jgi:hypothetical protein
VVAPITHTEPEDLSVAVEISAADAAVLGLDTETSWVIVDDLNYFTWIGYDVLENPATGTYEYRYLAPDLFNQLTEKFKELRKLGRLKPTSRD